MFLTTRVEPQAVRALKILQDSRMHVMIPACDGPGTARPLPPMNMGVAKRDIAGKLAAGQQQVRETR
jgi:hypothetical protein